MCGLQLVADARPDASDRKPLIHLPTVREDIRLLPSLLRNKPRVYLPLAMLLVGLPVFVLFAQGKLSLEIANVAYDYISFFFVPPALFTFFIVGLLAPRASYLFGFIYGLVAAIIWSVAFVLAGPAALSDPSAPSAPPPDVLAVVASLFVYGVLYGTLAAGLAGLVRYIGMALIRPADANQQS